MSSTCSIKEFPAENSTGGKGVTRGKTAQAVRKFPAENGTERKVYILYQKTNGEKKYR